MTSTGVVDDFLQQLARVEARLKRLENAAREDTHYVGTAGEPTFSGSWVSFDSARAAGFYRDGGRVYLVGAIKSGTIGTTAFQLPAEYCPSSAASGKPLGFEAMSNDARGELVVTYDGLVQPVIGSSLSFFLEGISFLHV